MTKIKEVMTRNVITLNPENTLKEAAQTLRENEISGAPVIKEKRLIGIVSEGDIIKALETTDLEHTLWLPAPFEFVEIPIRSLMQIQKIKNELKKVGEQQVKDVMTKNVKTVQPNDSLEKAAKKMSKHRINRLPVTENKKLVGIISREDILQGIVK